MDYDLFSRFMKEGKMERVDRFLGVFRTHEEAKTTQLMETVGKQEIKRVWDRYGLKPGRLDPFISARFYYGILRAGGKFAAKGYKRPGALPGVGWDYDQCWGGLLNDSRLPPQAVAIST
jgi:hypothetical protein